MCIIMVTNYNFDVNRLMWITFYGFIDPSTTNPAGFGYGAGEVRVYNRVLSAAEVQALYNSR